jgi:hypothetical protein
MQRIILAVLVASLGTVGSAQAQRAHTTRLPSRFFINGHSVAAFGTSVTPQGWDALKTSTGLGGGVQIGYAITPRLTAYAGYEIAKQPVDMFGLEGDFGLSHLEAGAHLSFPVRGSKMLPYLGAWVGRRGLTSTLEDLDTGASQDFSLSGMAAGVSGGMQYFVSPVLALDGGVSLGMGKFGNVRIDHQKQVMPQMNNSTTMRVQFGANWYP